MKVACVIKISWTVEVYFSSSPELPWLSGSLIPSKVQQQHGMSRNGEKGISEQETSLGFVVFILAAEYQFTDEALQEREGKIRAELKNRRPEQIAPDIIGIGTSVEELMLGLLCV